MTIVRFLALVTTMVTKVDHGNYGWLPRLVTMVTKELTMVTDSVARTFFLLLMIFVIFWPKVRDF